MKENAKNVIEGSLKSGNDVVVVDAKSNTSNLCDFFEDLKRKDRTLQINCTNQVEELNKIIKNKA